MGERAPTPETAVAQRQSELTCRPIGLSRIVGAAILTIVCTTANAVAPVRPSGIGAAPPTLIALPLARLGSGDDPDPPLPRTSVAPTLGFLAMPSPAFIDLVPDRIEGGIEARGGGLFAAAVPAGSGWTSVSGLPWRSGQACTTKDNMETYRGRRHDVYVDFAGRANFADVTRVVANWHPRAYRSRPGRLSLALPMLTNDMRQQWIRCLNGSLDRHFLDIGRALQANGLGDTIIRLGWEANGSGFPWNIRGNVSAYKACFQRQVRLLRSVAPGLEIDWTMRKSTAGPQGAHMLYPGDEFVDIIGVNYYDWWPAARTQREWDAAYSATYQGGPRGLGTWLSFARSRGKKLSLPEWGVAAASGGGDDNPFYVQKMHETFRRNAPSLAYESYFNCRDYHRIYPANRLPRASAAYRQLWSAGG